MCYQFLVKKDSYKTYLELVRDIFSRAENATSLEELYTDGGEHELQQESDKHDVVDGSYGDHDTLHHVLHIYSFTRFIEPHLISYLPD